ncbi:D-sedoheptulose-7-phosphate isomerase [Acuticoccus mangrovi]|uniref:SIS domain-containing protein n=1 Tax=Acuticoccus mangrovi TaxID=2796142 RepID=A0A934IV76_9HYPH|nr:SIS domain-containing protein [Acuticoccus mangrovi]MBJ3778747.1 SIS domain-containing protein [Acuticoccus mangrovi]
METNWANWLDDYYKRYEKGFSPEIYDTLIEFKDLALKTKDAGGKLIFNGNGASSAISSHCALDFTKQGGIRSVTFSDASFITAYGNDYGYELWLSKALEHHADPADAVVLISVSGTSPNVVSAAKTARDMDLPVVTFTGKTADNPLRALGTLNFWMDSASYNVVEAVHMIWITTVVDMIIGKAEYSVS